jgi:hypothetical protein
VTLRGSARVCLTFNTVSMEGSAMDRYETVITLTYTRETRTSYGTRILVSISAAHFADDIITVSFHFSILPFFTQSFAKSAAMLATAAAARSASVGGSGCAPRITLPGRSPVGTPSLLTTTPYRKKTHRSLFECFRYACPEPVLVK